MKRPNSTLAFALLMALPLGAQTIIPVTATMQTNHVQAQLASNGQLFTDPSGGRFIPVEPGLAQKSLLRGSGLWIVGKDVAGNLTGAIARNAATDFQPGLIDADFFTHIDFNGIWHNSCSSIVHHQQDFADNGVIDQPDPEIFGYPGSGNSYFSAYNNQLSLPFSPSPLAGYYDRNETSSYDPESGEYPVLQIRGCRLDMFADEQNWFVSNDLGAHPSGLAPINLEVQTQVFAYRQPGDSPLNRTLFVRHMIINRASEPVGSCHFGVYADFDIGNPDDDFLGSIPGRSTLYGYNGDTDDENGFGANIPVMAVQALRGPLDTLGLESTVNYMMVVEDVESLQPNEVYNVLSGKLPDGTPAPNNGKMYPGNPNLPGSNSEPGAGNIPGRRAGVISFKPITLLPGAVSEVILAYYYSYSDGATPLQQVQHLLDGPDFARALFDNCFDLAPECLTGTPVREPYAVDLSVSPNPGAAYFLISSQHQGFSRIRLTDLAGRQLQVIDTGVPAMQYELDVRNLPNGVYLLNIDGKAQKVVVQR